ncbi:MULTISPECIES: phosphoribosylanthranilate isomerase [Vagococcus]|uniref:N-(5'-phosphoribosyl)anthranilate isomerase n=1 Tax=Vagococcus fluvialis bH819 TaxID=1255619 RepID=A0A1X6WMD9_9ENTE|nr:MULTISPECIES: phosphoribosylanthranilate isomerase [Vagococcus]SLM85511.1 Phosphoribosylanthranilate isomerase [Vagococcus fluvialis bH819]HCM89478.1 phosphoribosylanthranilate isomerase [Vagococcus sp.]
MVKKQIYSIVNFNEAVQTMDAGADHIGLVPMQTGGIPAHRVPFDVVDKIFAECKKRGVKSIAIMLNKDIEEMFFIIKRVNPDIVHIAGMDYTADQSFADRLRKECPGVELMQAVLVADETAIDRAKEYAKFCDYILTDSGLAKDTGIGASGLTHDWSIDRKIVETVGIPVIIAGGLGAENVAECIKQIRPFGVDSLTKTSYKFEDGVTEKNIPEVKKFCERADQAAAEVGLK